MAKFMFMRMVEVPKVESKEGFDALESKQRKEIIAQMEFFESLLDVQPPRGNQTDCLNLARLNLEWQGLLGRLPSKLMLCFCAHFIIGDI